MTYDDHDSDGNEIPADEDRVDDGGIGSDPYDAEPDFDGIQDDQLGQPNKAVQ